MSQPRRQKLPGDSPHVLGLTAELVCGWQPLDRVTQRRRAVGHRRPVDRRVAFADDDLERAGDRVDRPGRVAGRRQHRTDGGRGVGGGPERHAAAEAVAKEADPLEAVGGPRQCVHGIGRLPLARVPVAVVEAQAGYLGRQRVAHRPEPRVRAGAPVLGMGGTRHDRAVGAGAVQPPDDLAAAGDDDGVAHTDSEAGETPVTVGEVVSYVPGQDEPSPMTGDTSDVETQSQPEPRSAVSHSDRRRRSVRQLLFVIAGAHTGAFVGSVVPTFGLAGDTVSVALVVMLLVLPFAVDANWERIDRLWLRLVGEE